jgi:hypothetical protein
VKGLRFFALVVTLALASNAPDLIGQEVSVRSHLDRTEVGVNRGFTLSVVIDGVDRGGWNPDLPDISGFARFISSSTNQSFQVINGKTDVSYTLIYQFQASQIGRFTIPPITVDVQGQTYRTEPITLTISERPPATATGPNGTGEEGVSADDLFIEATTDRSRVFTGQPVVVEYRIFTKVSISSYNLTELPAASGFWVEEYDASQARPETIVREGEEYTTLLLRKVALFPTSSGTKIIAPMNLDAEVRVRSNRRTQLSLGSSLFGRSETIPISSEPLSVEVLPLPEEGRPGDFSGFVGNLSVTSTLDRTDIETNDALTYNVRVTGTGNMGTLPDLETNFPSDFEVFPPAITNRTDTDSERIGGRKTYSYVLIPRSPGQYSLPAIEISYFNPRTRSYERARSNPFEVTVTGDPVSASIAGTRGRSAIQPLREDIRFIQIANPDLRTSNVSILGSTAFWLTLLVPLAGLGGAAGVRRHQNRLSGDVAYARRRRANRKARKKFQAARDLLSEDTRKEFYAEVANALQGFLGDKLNISEAGFMTDQVGQQLLDLNAPEKAVSELVDCVRICERQRFAPSRAGREEMEVFLKRAEDAVATIAEALG